MYILHKIKHFWACYTTYILSYKIYRRKYLLLKWCLCCHENIIIRGKIIIDCIFYNKILLFKIPISSCNVEFWKIHYLNSFYEYVFLMLYKQLLVSISNRKALQKMLSVSLHLFKSPKAWSIKWDYTHVKMQFYLPYTILYPENLYVSLRIEWIRDTINIHILIPIDKHILCRWTLFLFSKYDISYGFYTNSS